MIAQWKISIKDDPGHSLYVDSAYRLYAFLLEQLSPDDAFWLHEIGGGAISQFLRFDKETETNIWTINVLSEEAERILYPILEKADELRIENAIFKIEKKTFDQVASEELILQGREVHQNRIRMLFDSPAAFKQSGRYTIFPQEKLLLQSLINRWNDMFPEYVLDDEDAFQALLSGIHIIDYRLKTTRFSLKGVKIPGFMGSCVIESKLSLPLQELWNALVLFSEYAGIGIKTSLGMGGVRVKM